MSDRDGVFCLLGDFCFGGPADKRELFRKAQSKKKCEHLHLAGAHPSRRRPGADLDRGCDGEQLFHCNTSALLHNEILLQYTAISQYVIQALVILGAMVVNHDIQRPMLFLAAATAGIGNDFEGCLCGLGGGCLGGG